MRLGSHVEVKRDDGKMVSFSMADYDKLAYGYASTIHKSQGMTVDRAMVWGSASLDRHLGYVAMSRHRERLEIATREKEKRWARPVGSKNPATQPTTTNDIQHTTKGPY